MLRLASPVNTALLRRVAQSVAVAIGFAFSFLPAAYAAALSPESAVSLRDMRSMLQGGRGRVP